MRACPSCGAENPDRARFCLECGTAFQDEAPVRHEVRKTVTVLFTDVSGFTTLGEQLDPEALRLIMGRTFAAIRGVVERHGGTVEKYIGDAVMAVFGVPVVHEDDALRAVRAASELEAALAPLNDELASMRRIAIRVRTGVNTGEAVVGPPGSESLVMGDVVNVAARLQQIAEPGEVIVGQATSWLVRDAVRIEPLDPLMLKGKSGPVAACRLLEVRRGVEGRARRLDAPMVGRERELAAIRQALERATSDRTAQLFTVFGTAGVGKSRLVREFLATVQGETTVHRGRCLPYGEGITYWPVVEIVQAAAGIEDSDPAVEARAKLARLLEGLPDGGLIVERIDQVVGLAPGVAPQEEIFWAIRRFLARLAADQPLVLVVDDIHWAEPTLLDLLEHVVDLTRDLSLLVLVSARPELLEARPGWGGGRFNATAILLEPLSENASAALVDSLLPGTGTADSVRDRITAAAEGNPLYVEELVGMLIDEGVIRQTTDLAWQATRDLATVPIPPTIQALLAARLDRLDPVERAVAERASVVGRVFGQDAVEQLSPELQRSAVEGRLTDLVRKDLIRPEMTAPSGEGAFRFRHILIRDAAYESLPKAARAELHERFATWLEAVSGDRLAEVEEIVAYHLEQAIHYLRELGVGEPIDHLARRASVRLGSAADRAFGRSDMRAAVTLLARTVEVTPEDDPSRGWRELDLAVALATTGRMSEAAAVLDRVVARAEATADDRLASHARIQGWWVVKGYRGTEAEAIRDAQGSIAGFEAIEDHLGLARAWGLIANARWSAGEAGSAEAAATRALEAARRGGHRHEQVLAYDVLSSLFHTGPTPIGDAIPRCEAVLASEAGNRAIEGWMWHALAHLRARLGEVDQARVLAARSRAVLEEYGQVLNHASLSELVADVEVVAGDPAAAVRALEDGLAVAAQFDRSDSMLGSFLARAAWDAGDVSTAEQGAELGTTGASWIKAVADAYLGRIRAVQGRPDEGESLVRSALDFMERTDFLNFRAWVWECLADVQRMQGKSEDAVRALETAIGLHEAKGSLLPAAQARARLADLRAGMTAR